MTVDLNKKESLRAVLQFIETIVEKRKLSREHHRDEVEKYLNFIIQGRDMINPYERRNAKVSDELWDQAVLKFRKDFGLSMETEEEDKLE
jgi:hypothetical protein